MSLAAEAAGQDLSENEISMKLTAEEDLEVVL